MIASLRHWAASHPGTVRTKNEDAYLCRPEIGLFAVADGVGGHPGGGFASAEVVRALNEIEEGLTPADLLNAVRTRLRDVHQRLQKEAAGNRKTSAATTVVVLLLHGDHLACIWAGDSRAYLLRRGQLFALTADHSLVSEMARAGKLSDGRVDMHLTSNSITRAIGVASSSALVDKVIGSIESGDRFLLCSDGLTKVLQEEEIAARLMGDDPAAALLAAALDGNAKDNVTALVTSI
jgi:serine/threonine protein phosphatase PrpC